MAVLRELLLQPELPALWNNVASSLLMVLFYRAVTEFAGWLRVRFGMAAQSRQILQMSLSAAVVFWPLFDTSEWSWRLNAILPSALLARILYKAKLNDPEDMDVQNLSRSSSPSELLFGPLQLCCVMIWLGLYQFMTQEAAILAAAIGVGDGLAPMIGSRYGRHFYHMPFSGRKTMEGSIVGVFLGTSIACYLYAYMMGIPIPPLRYVLVYGFVAAVVEGTSPGNFDNMSTALVMHFSLDKVHEWLPP
ncbi:ADP-ribosylglycohydrolase [Seminavis robusta]|uniref:ADP-ribosylglycohydrolase n=1 Tax=Seminavis robusta TaxID=568900 RepID=A0A9N8DR46_9STRA|nr:ADP-ribosylglycohydrolase [Seminavis robusta]|eukprot:Sro311_g114290.1 ADP-ribosylglycohydrolase (248) ;mRNA; r:37539-38393